MAQPAPSSSSAEPDAAVKAVVDAFERRVEGGHQYARSARHSRRRPPSRPHYTAALFFPVFCRAAVKMMAKAKKEKGGSRHSKKKEQEADEDEDEDDPLPEYIRLEEQPKCITGGRMRDYQVRMPCQTRARASTRGGRAIHSCVYRVYACASARGPQLAALHARPGAERYPGRRDGIRYVHRTCARPRGTCVRVERGRAPSCSPRPPLLLSS